SAAPRPRAPVLRSGSLRGRGPRGAGGAKAVRSRRESLRQEPQRDPIFFSSLARRSVWILSATLARFQPTRLEAPGGSVNLNRRTFTKSVAGALGSLVPASWGGPSAAARASTPVPLQRAEARLSPAKVTKIRDFYRPN